MGTSVSLYETLTPLNTDSFVLIPIEQQQYPVQRHILLIHIE